MYLLTKEQIIPTLLLLLLLLSRHSTLFFLFPSCCLVKCLGLRMFNIGQRNVGARNSKRKKKKVDFSPSSGAGRVKFPSQTTEKVPFFVFSPLLIPTGVTSRSCRQQQQQWRCFIQSGSLVYSWPVLTQEEGKKKEKKGSRASWFSYLTLVKQTRAGLPTFLLFFPSGGAGYSLHNADAASSLFAAV